MAIKFEKMSDGLYRLDCCGYVCPHPQIYTKKMLEKIQQGDTLEVTFDNPSSSESITAMISGSGNEIVDTTFEGGRYIFKIRKNR
jgi:tRNA 2-thiouridine synthesizing protein A